MKSFPCLLRAWAVFGLVLFFSGCGVLGEFALFQSEHPLLVSTVELVRSPSGSSRGGVQPPSQTLAIALPSGRVGFTDTNGRTYPQQLRPEMAIQIQELLEDRSYVKVKNIKPAKTASRPIYYRLKVVAEGQSDKIIRFAHPPRRPLPQSVAALVDTFDRAHRMVHPLSTELNLLE